MSEKLDSLEDRLKISQTYAASVAYFLVAFAHAEEEMDRAIWAILSLKQEGGYAITASVRDFGQRMMLLARLGKVLITKPDIRNDCSNVIRALQFINKHRTDLAHGTPVAVYIEHDSVLLKRSAPDQSNIKHRPARFSTDFLCDLAEYALLVQGALRALQSSIERGSRREPPSLDKLPEQYIQEVQKTQ